MTAWNLFAVSVSGPDGRRHLMRVADLREYLFRAIVAARVSLGDLLAIAATQEAAAAIADAVVDLVEDLGLVGIDPVDERFVLTSAGRAVVEAMAAGRGEGWRCSHCGATETRGTTVPGVRHRRYVEACTACGAPAGSTPVRITDAESS